MRKKTLIGLAIVLATVLGSGIAFAHYWGWGGYGGHMMAPGYGGPMMAPGYAGFMMSPGYSGSCWGNEQGFSGKASSLTKKDMESVLRNYIGSNPNLKVGEIKDKGAFFEGEIVTKENSLVARFNIDKNTGVVQPLY